jgi:hypothetical protein
LVIIVGAYVNDLKQMPTNTIPLQGAENSGGFIVPVNSATLPFMASCGSYPTKCKVLKLEIKNIHYLWIQDHFFGNGFGFLDSCNSNCSKWMYSMNEFTCF